MAALDTSRYNELCRLCATKTTLLSGLHLFNNDGLAGLVRKKIESCLPVQIHENDELPKLICQHCLYKLNFIAEFRDRTIRTERLLLDLYKELAENKMDPHSVNVVSLERLDQDLLMTHQHQNLLANHGITSVDEIDLSQLGAREQMIVGHEIILTHQSIDINGHALENLNINHHELTNQDLSNHSLQAQDSMAVDIAGPHDLDSARFTGDNLDLIQHQQLLTDQFRLQHDLHVNISEAGSMELDGHLNSVVHEKLDENVHHPDNTTYHIPDDKSHSLNYHNASQQPQPPNILENRPKSEPPKGGEDSNSSNSLLIDERLNGVNERDNVFVMNDNSGSTEEKSSQPTNDWLYCNYCGQSFEFRTEFDTHFRTHFQKCDTCLAMVPLNEYEMHCKEAHGTIDEPKPIKTRLKRATLPIKNQSESHSEDSGGDFPDDNEPQEDDENDNVANGAPEKSTGKRKIWSPKICMECGKTYKTNYKLNEHMRKHTGEKPYKCDNCDKEFRSKIGLAQHAAKHTGHYDYSCPICGKGFQCKSYLMVHQRVHSDVKPYPCTTCGRNFKTKQSLLDHTNRHLGVKPYLCDICGRGFITKGLCKAHQKVHTGLDNRKYSCKVCQKMFVSKSYLQTHLRIHTGEKPFICEVCGKGFLTKVDLRIHNTMHTGEKSYVCEMCGKAFARRDALRCHRRSHTGERPYSCDLCGQTFTQFTPMAIHKRLHTGERPYACESCGKTFVSRSTMMSHAKKHAR